MTETPTVSWIQEVRERLASPAPRRLAAVAGHPAAELRPAAVLVPLYVDAGELWTVLTRRTDTLPNHPGQIAFPGGSRDPGEDPWTTALREATEEVGLDAARVVRLGELDEHEVPSGFRIVPCVGAIPFRPQLSPDATLPASPYAMRPSEAEIAEIFSLPLSAFANPRLIEERGVVLDGVRRDLRIYHVGRRQIWGVTARILQTLLVRLGLESSTEEPAE